MARPTRAARALAQAAHHLSRWTPRRSHRWSAAPRDAWLLPRELESARFHP